MTRNRNCFAILGLLCMVGGCNLGLDDLLHPDVDNGDSSESGDDDGGSDDGSAPSDDDGAAPAESGSDDDGGADDAADTSDGGADPSGGDVGEVPAEILGAWISGDQSAAMLIELYDDGTFAQGLYYEYDDEGCWTTGTEAYSGTFAIDATTLTLAADAGAQELDQCGTMSEGQDIAATVELAWSLGVDDLGDALTLDDGTGALVFHRSEEGGGGA
jgi:hypothetical protein